jgi:peroxiredoxin (alkyl hydroperoxide reductase subunit C)
VTQLKVGDRAPDFTLLNQNNEPVKLSSFRGKKNVTLAFWGQSFAGGASREIKAYIVDSQFIAATDTEIVGISDEAAPVIKKFAGEAGAKFNLLSDPRGEVARMYGVFLERWGTPRRSTFIIDKQGVIRYIQASD